MQSTRLSGTGWLLSVLVVAQLLSSAWFRGTHHTNAVATHLRIADTARAVIPLVVGIFAWGGLYFRDSRIRQLLPVRRSA